MSSDLFQCSTRHRPPRPQVAAAEAEAITLLVASTVAVAGDEARGRPPEGRTLFSAKPQLLLGVGVQWNGPPDPAQPCRGCGGRQLPPVGYCLCCCRWGLDHLLPTQRPTPMRKATPKGGRLKGGC